MFWKFNMVRKKEPRAMKIKQKFLCPLGNAQYEILVMTREGLWDEGRGTASRGGARGWSGTGQPVRGTRPLIMTPTEPIFNLTSEPEVISYADRKHWMSGWEIKTPMIHSDSRSRKSVGTFLNWFLKPDTLQKDQIIFNQCLTWKQYLPMSILTLS